MNKSIRTEVTDYALGRMLLDDIDEDNFWRVPYEIYASKFFIFGHGNAENWLEKHDIKLWEAVAYVLEQEKLSWCRPTLIQANLNPERLVNLLVYYVAEELFFKNERDSWINKFNQN